MRFHLSEKQGLYDPSFEHDSCGVGFLCDIKGKRTNKLFNNGLHVLKKLSHRGATGSDPKTGDGAGVLIQIPHDFFMEACEENKINLPSPGEYGTGLVFFPQNKEERQFCRDIFSQTIKNNEQFLLGWRPVPVDNSTIGKTARDTQPVIEQVFIRKNPGIKEQDDFERILYIIRKKTENIIRSSHLSQKSFFYVTNISSKTISYKGLLMPAQMEEFFLDLKNEKIKTSICIVHSRYSTNTFPTWDLAQPFRFLAHNGEINTLRGNINWTKAREGLLKSGLFSNEIENIKPVIVPGGSDSASLDNIFELLTLSGRSLPHAMMMLIPAAYEQDNSMSGEIRDFYRYHACLTEPWDGPAAVAFTDGKCVGAVLDRNGLRPARYIITNKGMVVMASEVGVLDVNPSDISISGRLEPGRIFYIDTEEGRIIDDKEIKEKMSKRKPYGTWIKENMSELDKLPSREAEGNFHNPETDIIKCLKAFGYSREDMKVLIKPMVENGAEPNGSMGNDTPHAVLSKNPQLLFTYFKQLFAQVTNPAIDSVREEIVMSLETYIGQERNLLDETFLHAKKLKVEQPVLTDQELEKIRHIDKNGFKTRTISILFDIGARNGFINAINRICDESEDAIKEGYTFIILSDRGVNRQSMSLPSLLAVGAVHQHLIRKSMRTQLGIILETGEPREVHHFALLFGYGADCINPYLAYETIQFLLRKEEIEMDFYSARKNYVKAVNKGLLKILSKMGISTLRSYKGAQIFEAVGLNSEVMERCFTGTPSRIEGAGFNEIEQETTLRHKQAFPESDAFIPILPTGGLYQWKKDGEYHLWNPETIAALQDSTRNDDYNKYKFFAGMINDQSKNPTTLRSLLKFKKTMSVPVEEVEPVENIVKRFVTGAMSFGSISKEAHETIAITMNRIGGKSNSGEGGEDPARFIPLPDGDSLRSATKQVASGRFGVATNYLINADELQIKIAQGAKPGEGGQLPGHKVSTIIAKTRYTTPGVTLISPPPHHDIYSIEDLKQLIFDLKNVNPSARISVKLVSEMGVGTIAAGVVKGHADMILISGGDGGTGASPLSSIKHAGLPWELGLSETHQTLVLNDLRSRVILQTDGQMRTGRDVVIAAFLGAEEFGFATSALIVLGCVMLRHCHLNNCSVGVATQDEILRKRFMGSSEYLVNYFYFVAREVREIMAESGFRKIDEMIGRTDILELNKEILPWKAKKIDYSKILYKPGVSKDVSVRRTIAQNHEIDDVLDVKLINLAKITLEKKHPVKIKMAIKNSDRTTGAMLSGKVCENFGENGLPEDTIYCKFKGYAGQSFGAFLTKGVTFELEGLANDYVGKGLSGGKLIIYPDKKSKYIPEKNIIIGNTTFYGAISGEAYIRGIAGERFCIRNSGLYAVVEGTGDHGCEYMTGGRVVILGKTGRNFAAGMSGGIAYVRNIDGNFEERCNLSMVELEDLNDEDRTIILNLLTNHHRLTASSIAGDILANPEKEMKKFVKVMPLEYKQLLKNKEIEEKLELTEVSDG
ncbi:MAG: glutamate synthase large subunit [Candidatus Omnitrophica bacterium]|nr:glutamate synthase large subunit [Candidatus Omnitrophota bacterium]